MTITASVVGELIKLPVRTGEGKPVEIRVEAACDDKHGGRWFCVTHQERFDNQLQKDFHVTDGTHELVWICFDHGPEAP